MSFENPSDDELRLLAALVDISEQAFGVSAACLDHGCISAGEHAVRLLGKYDLVVPEGRGGSWTTKSNVLARLKYDLSNSDQIRKELGELPAGQLRTFPPGVRALRPDIFLADLRMWVPGRAMDRRFGQNGYSQPGPDRLDVEARLGLGEGEAVIRGELLTTGELRAFRNQLAAMEDGSAQRAHLVAFKETLEITLIVGSDGKYAGEITLRNPMYHHSATAEIRSGVYLDRTIRGLDEVLAKFA